MAKDVTKIKEQMRAEFSKLKDELKLEWKSSRESFKRNIQSDIREVRNEQEEMARRIEHAHAVFADLGKRLEDEIAKNSKLAKDPRTREAL